MKILLDQNLTEYVRDLLPAHEVVHASELGWSRLTNGELLAAAEKARFDVLLTADQSIPSQNNLRGVRIALVILSTNRWPTIRDAAGVISRGLEGLEPGEVREVALPRRAPRRRRGPSTPANS